MRRLIVLVLLFAAPLCASAKDARSTATWETVWDFRHGQIPGGEWERAGLTGFDRTEEGLHIHTLTDGRLSHLGPANHPVEAIRFVFGPSQEAALALRWHAVGSPAGEYLDLPFLIPLSTSDQTVDLDMSLYQAWDPGTDKLGVVFAAGTDVTLKEVRLRGWSRFGHVTEAVRSFWTFDAYTPTSINFLWGPHVTFTDLGRLHLFDADPPRAWSGYRAVYAVLFLIGIAILVASRTVQRRFAPVALFLFCLFVLWIVLDFRMGLETLSYAVQDYRTFTSRTPEDRTLRGSGIFAVLDRSLPYLKDSPRYVFLTEDEEAYVSLVRYVAFPSLPVGPENLKEHAAVWLVFRYGDASVDDQGRIVLGGRPISPPGEVIERFDDSSFLFKTL